MKMKNKLELDDLNNAFINSLFYKCVMVKNGLDCYFGKYTNTIIEETEKYFVIQMTPKPYAKTLDIVKVRFDFTPSYYGSLYKIINISFVE